MGIYVEVLTVGIVRPKSTLQKELTKGDVGDAHGRVLLHCQRGVGVQSWMQRAYCHS